MKEKEEVYESLVNQLKVKGSDVAHFVDLISDYVSLLDIKNDLVKNIEEVGTIYFTHNTQGDTIQKTNPSIRELTAINRQMLAILKQLDLTTDTVSGVDEDEEM